jgi:hypothetical protein
MAVQLDISYETLVSLVEKLPNEQQHDLLLRLLVKSKNEPLTVDDRLALLDSMVVDLGPVLPGYSDRREDWYGDDGR